MPTIRDMRSSDVWIAGRAAAETVAAAATADPRSMDEHVGWPLPRV